MLHYQVTKIGIATFSIVLKVEFGVCKKRVRRYGKSTRKEKTEDERIRIAGIACTKKWKD